MITNERKKEIIKILDNVDDLVAYRHKMPMDEIVFMFEYCRSIKAVNGDPAHRSMFLLADCVKNYVGWYSLRNGYANTITFIQNGCVYLFTDRKKAEIAEKEFIKSGYDVIIHDAEPELAEDTVFTALRCGAKELVINKGSDDEGSISTRYIWTFSEAMNGWTHEEGRLSRAVAEYSIEMNSKYKRNYDATFLNFIGQMELEGVYYWATPEAPDVPKAISASEDETILSYCIFTQMDELCRFFGQQRRNIKKEPFSSIYKRLGGSYVINCASYGIVFDHSVSQWAVDFRTDYNTITQEVKKYISDPAEVKKTTDFIMTTDKLFIEFLKGLTPDGFEYPQENAFTVAGYTAQILQRIVAENHVQAYSKLGRMLLYPDSIPKIISGN